MNLPSETLAWLRAHKMQRSISSCLCIQWLINSRCTQKFRNSGRHLDFDPFDRPWLDHPTGFTYARKPTLLLLQSYGHPAYSAILADLHSAITPPPRDKPFVKVALRAPSPEPLLDWYSPRTTAIEVWNFHNLPPTLAAEIEKPAKLLANHFPFIPTRPILELHNKTRRTGQPGSPAPRSHP